MKARIALVALLVATVALGIGCKTTIVGSGGEMQASYRLGTLTAHEDRGIDAVYEAAGNAVTGLGLNVVQKTKDALQAEIVARDTQDKKITIKLLSVTSNSTKLKISAGSLEKDRRIYEAIQNNLGSGM